MLVRLTYDNVLYPDPVLAHFPINEVRVKVVFHPSRYKEKLRTASRLALGIWEQETPIGPL